MGNWRIACIIFILTLSLILIPNYSSSSNCRIDATSLNLITVVNTDKDIYEPGEEIQIEIIITNPLDVTVNLVSGGSPVERIVIKNQNGDTVYYYPHAVNCVMVYADLEPNESLHYNHSFSYAIDPGFYFIRGSAFSAPFDSALILINGSDISTVESDDFDRGFIFGIIFSSAIVMGIVIVFYLVSRSHGLLSKSR